MAQDMIAVFHGGRRRRRGQARGGRFGATSERHDRAARHLIEDYDDESVLGRRAASNCDIATAIERYGNAFSACEAALREAAWAGHPRDELRRMAAACGDFRANAQAIADAARRCAESGAVVAQSGGMMNRARGRRRR